MLLGSVLVLVSTSRAWLTVRLPQPLPLPVLVEHVTGAQVVPGARALALVALAGVAALFAARRTGRVVVGVLVLLSGAGVVWLVARALVDPAAALARAQSGPLRGVGVTGSPSFGGWPWVTGAGAVLVVLAGALVAVRGRRWAALSATYDAPGSAPAPAEPAPAEGTGDGPAPDKAVWDALDRGDDPTT